MYSFFKILPLNTSKVYTMAVDKSGCEIYVPIIVFENATMVKTRLEQILAQQPAPINDLPPTVA